MRPVWGARFRADHGQSGSYAFASVLVDALLDSGFRLTPIAKRKFRRLRFVFRIALY
jgi:hypothetical protein